MLTATAGNNREGSRRYMQKKKGCDVSIAPNLQFSVLPRMLNPFKNTSPSNKRQIKFQFYYRGRMQICLNLLIRAFRAASVRFLFGVRKACGDFSGFEASLFVQIDCRKHSLFISFFLSFFFARRENDNCREVRFLRSKYLICEPNTEFGGWLFNNQSHSVHTINILTVFIIRWQIYTSILTYK